MGGVGNQLFQIARACSHRENGYEVAVLQLSKHKKNLYRMIGFTDHENWIEIGDLANSLDIKIKDVSFSHLVSLAFLFFLRRLGINRYFNTEIDDESTIFGQYNIDVGYYQSNKHLTLSAVNEVSNALIELLGISCLKTNSDFVVHIRGGDFIKYNMEIKYDEIEKVKVLAKKRGKKIHIVTNDKKFALGFFDTQDNIYVNNSTDAMSDFLFLSASSTLFISNSTFAFWAAKIATIINNAELFGMSSFPWKDLISLKKIESS